MHILEYEVKIYLELMFVFLTACLCFRKTALRLLESREKNFDNLTSDHKQLLPNHKQTFDETRLCIDCNAAVIKELIQFSGDMFENTKYQEVRNGFNIMNSTKPVVFNLFCSFAPLQELCLKIDPCLWFRRCLKY